MVVLTGNPPRTREDYRVEARSSRDLDAVMDALAGADALIMGGGGLLHDHWGWQPETVLASGHWGLSLFAGIPLAAAARGKPVAMLAQGVGPLRSASAQGFSAAAFEAASLITVRDRESRRILRELGIRPSRIHQTADLGLLVPFDPPVNSRHCLARLSDHQVTTACGAVAVALRFWDRGVEPIRWQQALADGLRRFLQATGAQAVFVPLQHSADPRGDDAAVARVVAEEIGLPDQCHVVSGPLAVGAIVEVITRCGLVLAMRYHAAVFGIVAGTMPVGIAYDRKVASLMQDAGLGVFACCLPALTEERVAAMMANAWRRRTSLERRLQEARSCLVAAARRNLSLLDGWLERLPAVCGPARRHAEEALERAMRGYPPAP